MKTTISALVVVALLILGAYWYKTSKLSPAPSATSTPAQTVKTSAESKITQAEPGKVIEGFDMSLVLVKDAKFTSSWESVQGTTIGRTTSFTTVNSISALYTLYKNYLTKNGYTISREDAKNYSFISAAKGSVHVNYAARPINNGALVYVTEIK